MGSNYTVDASGNITSVGKIKTATSEVTSLTTPSVICNDSSGNLSSATIMSPLAFSSSSLSMTQATTSSNGYLTNTDWNTFNNKQVSGNYLTALSGDVLAVGPGAVTATIQPNAVTSAKIATNAVSNTNLAQMAAQTIKGNNTVSTANASDLSITSVLQLLSLNVTSGQVAFGNGASGLTSNANLTYNSGTNVLALGAGGITLPTSGGTAATLNYYETGSISMTFTGPVSLTTTIYYSKVGKNVTLMIASITGTSTSATFFTSSTTLPTRLVPVINADGTLYITDNGSGFQTPGRFLINTSGTINIYKANPATNFTGSGTCGWSDGQISYVGNV